MITAIVFVGVIEQLGRELARRPRPARDLSEAREWIIASAETFRSVLDAGDRGFVGIVVENRSAILALSFPRTWGAGPTPFNGDRLGSLADRVRGLR